MSAQLPPPPPPPKVDRRIWIDGRLVPWEQATVHLLSHSLQRGSLIFDYMSVHSTPRGPALFRLRDHVVSAYATSEGWPIVETDESFQLLAGVSRGTRAILVGPHHLIELNMERIARAVYSGGSPPAPPAAENKK